jgi:hypothetical protein
MSEYPKMLTVKRKDGRVLPVMRDGACVIFHSRKEEDRYRADGAQPHDGKPEMHSQPSPSYLYSPPDFTTRIHQRKAGEVP